MIYYVKVQKNADTGQESDSALDYQFKVVGTKDEHDAFIVYEGVFSDISDTSFFVQDREAPEGADQIINTGVLYQYTEKTMQSGCGCFKKTTKSYDIDECDWPFKQAIDYSTDAKTELTYQPLVAQNAQ